MARATVRRERTLLIGNGFRLVDLDGLVAEMAACCENGGGMAGRSAALGSLEDDGAEIALSRDRDLDVFCVQPQHHFERALAGVDSRCVRQSHQPYGLAQTGLADGDLQGLAIERREAARPIDSTAGAACCSPA